MPFAGTPLYEAVSSYIKHGPSIFHYCDFHHFDQMLADRIRFTVPRRHMLSPLCRYPEECLSMERLACNQRPLSYLP